MGIIFNVSRFLSFKVSKFGMPISGSGQKWSTHGLLVPCLLDERIDDADSVEFPFMAVEIDRCQDVGEGGRNHIKFSERCKQER